jgi:hypothetical protein
MGRLTRAGLAALLVSLAVAGAVQAHGGMVVATARNDAYKLTVQAIDMRLDGRPAVDLTAYPVRRSNGAPDLDADVSFRLGTREVAGRRQADGITAEIPIERTGAWRREPIAVRVTGTAGTITVRAAPRLKADDGPPTALYPATLAAILVLAGVAFVRRRGRDLTPEL